MAWMIRCSTFHIRHSTFDIRHFVRLVSLIVASSVRHSTFDIRHFVTLVSMVVASSLALAAPLPRLELLRPLRSGKAPYGLQISGDGQRLYVANFASDEVGVLDLSNPKAKMEMVYAGPEPIDLALTPQGDKLLVVNFRPGSVTVVSTQDWRMTDSIKIGGQPAAIAISPKGDRAFVANWGTGSIGQLDIIDLQNHQVLRSVKAGMSPLAVVVDQDAGIVYVANGGSNSITRVELQDYEASEFPCIEKPNGMALSRDGKRLYVTGAGGSELAMVDTGTLKETGRASVGNEPFGVAVHPGGWAVTADKGDGTMSVVAEDLSDVVKIKVGKSPNDVAFSRDGKFAYVSLEKDNRIAVVRLQ